MPLSSPQQQAGILSFYDAPERGPKLNAKLVLAVAAVFTILVIVIDHFAVL